MFLLAWIFVYHTAQRFKEGVRSFRSRVLGSCEPPCGSWLLTAESHLQMKHYGSLLPPFTYYNLSCQQWENWLLPFVICLLIGSSVCVVITERTSLIWRFKVWSALKSDTWTVTWYHNWKIPYLFTCHRLSSKSGIKSLSGCVKEAFMNFVFSFRSYSWNNLCICRYS